MKKRYAIKNAPNSVMRWVLFAALMLFAATLFLPFGWALITSVKSYEEYSIFENIIGLPQSLSLTSIFENIKTAWEQGYAYATIDGEMRYFTIVQQFLHSLLYAGGCMITATLVPCVTAYVTARYKYRFSKVVYNIVIFAMILPVVGALPSEIALTKALGTFDTFWGVWLQKANFLGTYFLIFFAQFKMIPAEYTEAARIDGASEFYTMTRVIMPLAKSSIATVALMNFVTFWNDYQVPMVFLPSRPVLALGMFQFSFRVGQVVSSVPMKIAYMIVVTIPILLLFLVSHKRLMGNISVGGLKG